MGLLGIAPNGRFFVGKGGKPLFWLPDQSLLESDPGRGDGLTLAARGTRGDWTVVSAPEPAALSVRAPKALAGRAFSAVWVDPRSGAAAGETSVHGASFSGRGPAGLEDALLVLR